MKRETLAKWTVDRLTSELWEIWSSSKAYLGSFVSSAIRVWVCTFYVQRIDVPFTPGD